MPTFNNGAISSFFNGPGTYAQAGQTNAAHAAHVAAVGSFFNWMAKANPDMYAKVLAKRPDLAQGTTVVASGALGAKSTKLKGMGDVTVPTGYVASDIYVPDVSAPIDPSLQAYAPATDWGTSLMSTINQVLPTYFNAQIAQNQIDFQKQQQQALLTYNIQRAEQGLPPVNSITSGSSMSPMTMLLIGAVAYFALAHK